MAVSRTLERPLELDKDKDSNFLMPRTAHRLREDFLFLHLLLLTGTRMAMEYHRHGRLLEYRLDHFLQQHLQEHIQELFPQVSLQYC